MTGYLISQVWREQNTEIIEQYINLRMQFIT